MLIYIDYLQTKFEIFSSIVLLYLVILETTKSQIPDLELMQNLHAHNN